MHDPKRHKTHPAGVSGRCCILLIALFSGACSTSGSVATEQSDNTRSQLVAPSDASLTDKAMASDIVRSASQLFTPFNTTLQFNNLHNDPMMDYFIALFTEAGFGIQRVNADQGSHYFSYAMVEDQAENGEPLIRFDTAIGAIKVGRDYTQGSSNTISPASPIRIAGTRAAVTVTDTANGKFRPGSAEVSRAIYTASLEIEDSTPAPIISLITSDLIEQLAGSASEGPSVQSLNSNRVEVGNVFHTRKSNFTSVLDDYESVHRQVVVFGNDSLVLGDSNKLLIEQLVRQHLQPEDLIGLLGCSNGHTDLDIGNEGLALGRARRMTEALLAQGVARHRILEEGCWAPVSAGEEIPARGVVLQVWRKA